MTYYHTLALNLTIYFPLIVSLLRLKKINRAYYPFIFFIWYNAFYETLSAIILEFGFYNITIFNFNVLLQYYFILWLFKRWNTFNRSDKDYRFLLVLLTAIWLVETIVYTKLISKFASYSVIISCLIIVLITINAINLLLIKERDSLFKHSLFIICWAFVLYFTVQLLTEIFYVYGLSFGDDFKTAITRIVVFTNFFCNIFYALAILWMPKKQAFSLQY